MTVPFPRFEFVGPACRQPDCDGVLIFTASIRKDESFMRCSKCHSSFDHRPTSERLAESVALIERLLESADSPPEPEER